MTADLRSSRSRLMETPQRPMTPNHIGHLVDRKLLEPELSDRIGLRRRNETSFGWSPAFLSGSRQNRGRPRRPIAFVGVGHLKHLSD